MSACRLRVRVGAFVCCVGCENHAVARSAVEERPSTGTLQLLAATTRKSEANRSLTKKVIRWPIRHENNAL